MLLIFTIVGLVSMVFLIATYCLLIFMMKRRIQKMAPPGSAEKGPIPIPVETAEAELVTEHPTTPIANTDQSLGSFDSAKMCYLPPNLYPTPKRTPFGGARIPATFGFSRSSLCQSLNLEGLVNLNSQLEALKNQGNHACIKETFTASRSSLCHVLSLEGLANLNAQLEALKSQGNHACLNETFMSSMSEMGQGLSLDDLANLNHAYLNDTFTSSRSSLDLNLEDKTNLNAQMESMKNQSANNQEDTDSGFGSGHCSETLGKALDQVLALHNQLEAAKAEQKPKIHRTMSLS